MNKIVSLALTLLFVVGCADDRGSPVDVSSTQVVIDTDPRNVDTPDTPPEDVDPCATITIEDQFMWCSCKPQCCETQEWFCPPVFGEPTMEKKQVVLNFCHDSDVPCKPLGINECDPPQILFMGECYEAYECPPGAQTLDYGWQYCEMEDGSLGKQNVVCDKGKLYFSDCQDCTEEICDGQDNDCDSLTDEDIGVEPCENECGPGNAICEDGVFVCYGPIPQEEICDYADNDCDGEIDEGQRNACDECGAVPAEECDGIDNDCNGFVDDELIEECSTACGVGVKVCVAGNWSGCTAKQPMPEICNGFDDDCNGLIDDGIECLCTVQDVGKLLPCFEPPLLCGQGYKTCLCNDPGCEEIVLSPCYAICHWLVDPPGSDPACDSLVGMPLNEEKCNNFDDNCNTLIDEGLIADCYTGPEGTLGIGICEAGNMTCNMGSWGSYTSDNIFIDNMCADQVLPKPEECNGIDDDCDGQVDWGKEVPETDILFVIDWSGSMIDEIEAVLIALNQFAAYYSLEDKLHWGLIVGPKQLAGEFEERLILVSDIAPFPDFLAAFAALGSDGMNTGSEMLLDGIYLSLHNISSGANMDMSATEWDTDVGESIPPKDVFTIGWRPTADKIIIVFSDEEEQSYMIPEISVEQIKNACISAPKTKIYTFSTNESWEWDEIASTCSGEYFQLSSNATQMYGSLMQILSEICNPE
tara:strand:+ start:1708 stop:3801 length:2094 start_codon:yes stop_codon:yes gene_type:complete